MKHSMGIGTQYGRPGPIHGIGIGPILIYYAGSDIGGAIARAQRVTW